MQHLRENEQYEGWLTLLSHLEKKHLWAQVELDHKNNVILLKLNSGSPEIGM